MGPKKPERLPEAAARRFIERADGDPFGVFDRSRESARG